MSILIVEDNPISAKILERNIQKRGYQAFIASNGREALEFLEASPDIQVVITDILMPEMDGLEFLRRLNEMPEHEELPIIVCSVAKDEETVRKAADLGCVYYFTKPFDSQILLEKISKLLKKEKPILQDKNYIRLRLSLDYEGYKELDAMLSELVFDTIALIEDQKAKGYPDDIAESVLKLSEGASLIGAERLNTALKRLKRKKDKNEEISADEEYPRILKELKILQRTLLSRPQIKIKYELPENAKVRLFIYKHKGPMVRRLLDEERMAGVYDVTWDGCGDHGERLEPGMYTIHLKAGTNVQQRVFRLE